MAESFFAWLETKLIDRLELAHPADARLAVFDYVGLLQPRPSALGLGRLSPAEFERSHRSAHLRRLVIQWLTILPWNQGNFQTMLPNAERCE